MEKESENTTKILFKSIDGKNTEKFQSLLTDDVSFHFGNAPAVEGNSAVGEAVSGFFSSIKAIQHELTDSWEVEGIIICRGTVHYTRHDLTTLSVPFANILTMENKLIKDYQIFVDISELYASS